MLRQDKLGTSDETRYDTIQHGDRANLRNYYSTFYFDLNSVDNQLHCNSSDHTSPYRIAIQSDLQCPILSILFLHFYLS